MRRQFLAASQEKIPGPTQQPRAQILVTPFFPPPEIPFRLLLDRAELPAGAFAALVMWLLVRLPRKLLRIEAREHACLGVI